MRAKPKHIAIIMDGNGRWAQSRGLPRTEGHRRGVEALRRTVRAAIELEIPYLTLFSFSSENWSRPKSEVSDLLGLLKRFIRLDLADLHANEVRIRIIGERFGVDDEIVGLLQEAEAMTRGNSRLDLTVAFNYGARSEIAGAARKLAEQVAAGTLRPEQIGVDTFAEALDTRGLPDPDLLIRTGGEKRLSNFLLWQLAYAELVFFEGYWPDFTRDHLVEAVDEFQRRERRYGGLGVRAPA